MTTQRRGTGIVSAASHARIGNDYRNWTSSAGVVFAARMILTQERDKERCRVLKSADATPVSVALLTLPAELMLTAFGIEALVKALWLKNGNTLVSHGQYRPMPCEKKKKWHDLVALCKDAGFDLKEGEKEVLDILSNAGRYRGRYPVARRNSDMRDIFFWSVDYDRIAGELITRLWRTLGISLNQVPIGGLPI